MRDQLGHRRGADAHTYAVGAAGQDHRHARAEHDAGDVGAGEVHQLLGEHVAGLDVRHDQDVGAARDRRLDALGGRGVHVDRIVEGERSVEDAAADLPAIGHLAQRRRVERGLHVRIHGLDRREDRDARLRDAEYVREVDRVLGNVALGLQVRGDVHRGVGDHQHALVRRHVEHEHVTDPPLGTQPGRRGDHRAHDLVGVEAPLHQALDLATRGQFRRLGGRGVTVCRGDQPVARDVDAALRGSRTHAGWRPDQHRLDQPEACRLERAEQRIGVARVHDRAADRRERTATLEQAREHAIEPQLDPFARGEVLGGVHASRSIQVVFSSVYLSKACSDLSRPVPDCLKPPNGTVMSSAS